MRTNRIQIAIGSPQANLEAIAERIAEQPDLLPEVLDGLQADTARVRYGCLKVLRRLSESQPGLLYPAFDAFVDLLDSEKTILKWGAIIILANLAVVDSENRIDALLDRYLRPISGPVLITAANTIGGAARMALAKPHLADTVVHALLQVETAEYQTRECRNVALGHVLKALDQLLEHIRNREAVVRFAHRQLGNRRHAVQSRARALIRKHERLDPRRAGRARTR